ncbi:NUDIX domain-containing protein [Candidatus Woesearchaeota archaeon]|nr:NUDIX domain-containing protein [Candidatus Woesearchaeota archaeon]MBW3021963.1 NUDIX domain-containing protein [Candidatus Woesearchaeota archaeon]
MKPRMDHVNIFIYDAKNRILLQHRTEDAPISPGTWGFFGGAIEDGESAEDAARRESYEELKYKMKNPELIERFYVKRPKYEGWRHIFLEKFDPGQKIELHEGQGMKWITVDEVEGLKMRQHNKEILLGVFNRISRH